MTAGPVVRDLGRAEYLPTWQAMRGFTAARTPDSADELWLVEHPPVFTLGLGGRSRAPAAPRRHRGRADRARRPGHLPRPRPGGRLHADRPAPARHLRQGTGLPDRAVGDPGAAQTPASRRSACAGRAGRVRALRPAPPANRRARQDRRRSGIKVSRGCSYHGRGAERGDGPGAVCTHRPLRLCGLRRSTRYTRRRDHLARGPADRLVARLAARISTHERAGPRPSDEFHRATASRPRCQYEAPPARAAVRPARQEEGRGKTARSPIPLKFVRRRGAAQAATWIRVRAGSPDSASTRSRASCASTGCTPCARKPRARTSASASARARRRS